MRSLVLATLGVFAFPVTATALRQAAIAYPPSGPAPSAAIRAIAANRTEEARAILQSASALELARDRRASYRLQAAQSFLFDGRYADAVDAYAKVLESGDARGIDTLTSWAHHGMAVAEALAGRTTRGGVGAKRPPGCSPCHPEPRGHTGNRPLGHAAPANVPFAVLWPG